MKKILILTIANIIIALLQTSFFFVFFSPQINPNLVFAFALSFVFLNKRDLSILSAFIGGLAFDLLSGGVVGFSSVIFICLIMLIFYSRQFIPKTWIFDSLLVFFAAFIYTLFNDFLFFRTFDWQILVGAFLTMVMTSLFYFINKRLGEMFGVLV